MAAEGDDETGEDQRDDDKKLDRREPEFNFAEKGDVENLRGLAACFKKEDGIRLMTYIDNDDGDSESYYENGNVEVWSPVLYDDTSRSKIIW